MAGVTFTGIRPRTSPMQRTAQGVKTALAGRGTASSGYAQGVSAQGLAGKLQGPRTGNASNPATRRALGAEPRRAQAARMQGGVAKSLRLIMGRLNRVRLERGFPAVGLNDLPDDARNELLRRVYSQYGWEYPG